jgi:hypothetical protein
MPCLLGTVASQKFGRFQPEQSQNQGSLHPAHQKKPMLDHFISSIWLQWMVFWTCHAFLALLLAKSLADFGESQAKTKVLCTQHTKKDTTGPLHFFHMAPMSDVTML